MLYSCYGNFLIHVVREQEIGNNFCIPKSSFLVIRGAIVDYQIVTKAFHKILKLLISRNKGWGLGKFLLINFYKEIGSNYFFFFIIWRLISSNPISSILSQENELADHKAGFVETQKNSKLFLRNGEIIMTKKSAAKSDIKLLFLRVSSLFI